MSKTEKHPIIKDICGFYRWLWEKEPWWQRVLIVIVGILIFPLVAILFFLLHKTRTK